MTAKYDTGMRTTPGMWQLLGELIEGEALPDSLNKAIYALREDEARVVERQGEAVTMGVGTGNGNLFIHGDYESIKAAQKIVLERDELRAEVELLRRGIVPRGDDMIVPVKLLDEINAAGAEWKAHAERLAEALRPHIEDLERSAVVLDQYPAMAPTAAEMRKAAAELRAALYPTAAQENDDA